MLPLVRSIATDICDVFRSVTGRRADLHKLLRKGARKAGQLYEDEIAESRADLQQEYDLIWQYREELESLGVILRKPEDGWIEFPASIDEREIFYSWHVGEQSIEFWRDGSSHYTNRVPLTEDV